MNLDKSTVIGIAGAGTMGAGIAQVAATFGHSVFLYDTSTEQLDKAKESLNKILNRLVEKKWITQDEMETTLANITITDQISNFKDCGLVIEAIFENLDVKKELMSNIEGLTNGDTILASNTSSLSIASISSALKTPEKFLGIHFFNPAPLMKLVEIVPSISTDDEVAASVKKFIDGWGKVTVMAKDTPGFIVNRVARPFYSEAIRIYEEGIADVATIDWVMKELGGFKMGPFELMDLIGHDVNFEVTSTVFKEFFYDPRFKPSFTQKRLVEAGRLGRKSGRGFYDYRDGAKNPEPDTDKEKGQKILNRILAMLINEACDAVFMNVATAKDVDLAMTNGVNYPKGLLAWGDEIGLDKVLDRLSSLQDEYGEDRYRPNPLLKKMVREKRTFFS
jgi:3-hydroxybutyryl-CoA dehydrogenase